MKRGDIMIGAAMLGLLLLSGAALPPPAGKFDPPGEFGISLPAGTNVGPIVRALDPYFDCMELIPAAVTGGEDILQSCEPEDMPATGNFRVHAH